MKQVGTTATAEELANRWASDPRWKGIERTYTAEDVVRLSGSVREEHTLARRGADRLWRQLHEQDYIHALGALTGGRAVQQVKAGLQVRHPFAYVSRLRDLQESSREGDFRDSQDRSRGGWATVYGYPARARTGN